MLGINRNPILLTDSYKLSHADQYPPGTSNIYSYFEARQGAQFPEMVFFGLQYSLKAYLAHQLTQDHIDEADEMVTAHLGTEAVFNRKGWEYILKEHKGRMPVRICAVPEGTVLP
ncbi:MAG: DUF5598 domain-containing protein, partial [Bacteroidales bacterium]|nr:DUF5598 domain-containing protein [Candidatus Latescibacterota bacterium]